MQIDGKHSNFYKRREEIINGNIKKIEVQHKKGKLSARERINVLFDKDSFKEFGLFAKSNSENFGLDKKDLYCDGVITGYGTIFGRKVFAYSQDFTISGGSVGLVHARKIVEIQKKALLAKCPIIGICDSGGARIQEGVDSLAGYGEIFQQNIEASGVIPQISVILGPCAGGAVYSPALTDFIFMSKQTSYMFITGPNVVKSITGEELTFSELGGSNVHSRESGVCDFVFDNDIETLEYVRKLVAFLPSSNEDRSSQIVDINSNECNNSLELLNTIIPDDNNLPYDMKQIIKTIIDNNDFYEVKSDFAKNIITGFAKICGRTVGIIANQPIELAGCLDVDASCKGARFVRFCDCFNIPIVSFIDVPGFLPGKKQESSGIIRHGAKLLYAYGEASVPKISIITRKAYGGAYIVMGSKHLNSDLNYAWDTAEVAVMGAEQAGEILFKELKDNQEKYNKKIQEYKDMFYNPYYSAQRGYVDEIIKPSTTRDIIHCGLELLKDKNVNKISKKHGNCPL